MYWADIMLFLLKIWEDWVFIVINGSGNGVGGEVVGILLVVCVMFQKKCNALEGIVKIFCNGCGIRL